MKILKLSLYLIAVRLSSCNDVQINLIISSLNVSLKIAYKVSQYSLLGTNKKMNYKLFPIFVNFSMAMASLDTRGVGKGYPHLLAFLKVKLKIGVLHRFENI